MRNFFTYAGKNISELGVYVSGKGTYTSPSRDVTAIQIAGRNGDLLIDNGRFNNVTIPYDAFIVRHMRGNFAALRAFLFSQKGYKRLEDTFHPDEFRLASISESINPELTQLNREGTFTINFSCKPQRFLKQGEYERTFTENGIIVNPTLFESKPLLRVFGTGSLALNGGIIRVNANEEYTDIDCDLMNAYKGTENRNRYVEFVSDSIYLSAGENEIRLEGVAVSVTPRWWTV